MKLVVLLAAITIAAPLAQPVPDLAKYQDEFNRLPQSQQWDWFNRIFRPKKYQEDLKKRKESKKKEQRKKKKEDDEEEEEEEEKPKSKKTSKFQDDLE
jgi:hypothetical protein